MDVKVATKSALNKPLNKSKARWNILRNAILNKNLGGNNMPHSVRNFTSYGLFSQTKCDCSNKSKFHLNDEGECLWISYACKDILQSKSVWIQHPNAKTDLQELSSFDNTGNVCIWPSEEVLAYYCTLHNSSFDGKSVIELGGGTSCLAALCIAIHSTPKSVVLSDGNTKCIDSIHSTLEMNSNNLQKQNVLVAQVRWDDPETYIDLTNQFDYVICADCLFFDQTRESLAKAIYKLLKPTGIALIFAPRRGNTLTQFVDICQERFAIVNEFDSYCCRISNCHKRETKRNKRYQADLHFPHLIELVK